MMKLNIKILEWDPRHIDIHFWCPKKINTNSSKTKEIVCKIQVEKIPSHHGKSQ